MQLFVDNLTNVDFSFLCPHRGLVGETWLTSVVLQGDLDEQGMVCDFGIVKKQLRNWLDSTIDHCLLVPTQSHAANLWNDANQQHLNWTFGENESLSCSSPHAAVTLIDAIEITPDSVAQWCVQQLRDTFPGNIENLTLSFTPEAIQSPYYHYSHGLKKHAGNCQRIAHGHRSKIEIWRNGELSFDDMDDWATAWRDIYIGTLADIDIDRSDSKRVTFSYSAQQGEFSLNMPTSRCYLIDTDTTVEFIAQHIAQQLKLASPADSFFVKAYEGWGKGAICLS
ncbi:6-carboxytetrahydropterin synthase [Teredinibacter waterburyi]|uniref:6-carboxytetrahydropterin synthase n=1 Tax=Teredinibacter waterburyi TaxID=1500538 RepID=UPI00165FF8A7|nr:6-carboxytetrahydropterin synthase [Teredinibacter waterburyi]